MNPTPLAASLLIMTTLTLPLVATADETSYYDTARVLSVVPQTERINTPRQECHSTYTPNNHYQRQNERDIGGAIIGGVAGGLIGSRIGKGRGRIASAAIGAVTGALVGDRLENRDRQVFATRPIERCTIVDNWQTINRNYLVTYNYNGRTFTTTMPNDPGNTISLRVLVAPEINNNHVSFLKQDNYRTNRGWRSRYGH